MSDEIASLIRCIPQTYLHTLRSYPPNFGAKDSRLTGPKNGCMSYFEICKASPYSENTLFTTFPSSLHHERRECGKKCVFTVG